MCWLLCWFDPPLYQQKIFNNYLPSYDYEVLLNGLHVCISSNPWNGKNEYVTQFQLIERLQLSLSEKHREDRLAENVVSKNTSINSQEAMDATSLPAAHFNQETNIEVIHEKYATSANQVMHTEAVKFKDENLSCLIFPKGQMLVASPHNHQFPLTHELPFCPRKYFYLPANCL